MSDAPMSAVVGPDQGVRLELVPFWREADVRNRDTPLDDDAKSVARWRELHDRDREERMYYVTKKAVYWGMLQAQMTLAVAAAGIWLAVLALSTPTR